VVRGVIDVGVVTVEIEMISVAAAEGEVDEEVIDAVVVVVVDFAAKIAEDEVKMFVAVFEEGVEVEKIVEADAEGEEMGVEAVSIGPVTD